MRPLAATVRYEATSFPLAVRVIPPNGEWAGAQWRTGSSHGQRTFGWIAFGQLPQDHPRGLISIETAFGPTPSVAAILRRLRSAGNVAFTGKPRRVSLAGFPGWELDGRVSGSSSQIFVPFSAKRDGPTPPDTHILDRGESFRIVVLDVRGKRVVLFLESVKLGPNEFQAFLSKANRLLDESLAFPG
jgi:hypothetical protein